MPKAFFVDSGEEVADGDEPFRYLGASLVAGADDLSTPDAAASQDQRPAVGPVVPSHRGIDVGCSAELTHCDHDRRLQQSSLLQVFEGTTSGQITLMARVPGGSLPGSQWMKSSLMPVTWEMASKTTSASKGRGSAPE